MPVEINKQFITDQIRLVHRSTQGPEWAHSFPPDISLLWLQQMYNVGYEVHGDTRFNWAEQNTWHKTSKWILGLLVTYYIK